MSEGLDFIQILPTNQMDLIQPQSESDRLDSRQPLGIKVQVAEALPSLQMDLAVMYILSEGLDFIQILPKNQMDLIQPQLESDELDSRQPHGIQIQVAAGLPSLQTDVAVMCIMSEGLDVIHILHQLESEGLDPRLNQVKLDRLDFTRDVQMDFE